MMRRKAALKAEKEGWKLMKKCLNHTDGDEGSLHHKYKDSQPT